MISQAQEALTVIKDEANTCEISFEKNLEEFIFPLHWKSEQEE